MRRWNYRETFHEKKVVYMAHGAILYTERGLCTSFNLTSFPLCSRHCFKKGFMACSSWEHLLFVPVAKQLWVQHVLFIFEHTLN